MPELAAVVFTIYRIIPAVGEQVDACEIAVDSKVRGVIRIDESANLRVIVATTEVVALGLYIVVVPAIPQGG